MTGNEAPGGKPIAGERETCEHEWVYERHTKETDTYYHIWHVTNLLVCKHCKDVQIQSTYEVPEQCAPWMPFDDDY